MFHRHFRRKNKSHYFTAYLIKKNVLLQIASFGIIIIILYFAKVVAAKNRKLSGKKGSLKEETFHERKNQFSQCVVADDAFTLMRLQVVRAHK